MKAIWNGQLLAESDDTIVMEGSHYFPFGSINREYFRESDTNTFCPWKGIAYYFDIHVNGDLCTDAAWYFPEPTELAKKAKGRVAFRNGVKVIK